jgi:hypothetical protein
VLLGVFCGHICPSVQLNKTEFLQAFQKYISTELLNVELQEKCVLSLQRILDIFHKTLKGTFHKYVLFYFAYATDLGVYRRYGLQTHFSKGDQAKYRPNILHRLRNDYPLYFVKYSTHLELIQIRTLVHYYVMYNVSALREMFFS